MTDRPQYPSYPGPDHGQAQVPPRLPYGQAPPLPGYGYPPPPAQGYPPVPPPGNGMAITAMVLGIVSIVFCWIGLLFAVAAVIVSVLALKQISARPPGQSSGYGMAITGLVTGLVGTLLWGGVLALTFWG